MPPSYILIADDDQNVRDLLKDVLEYEDYRLFLATNGKEAVEIAQNNHVDVALLDWKMPVMDGLDALREIKAIDETIEVLIMSAYADMESLNQIQGLGASDYIIKPFHKRDVTRTIRNALIKRGFIKERYGVKEELERRIDELEREFEERTHQLRESQIKYKQIVENSNDMIIVVQDGKLRFANRMALDSLGYAQEEILDLPFIQMVHSEDRHTVEEELASRLRGESLESPYAFRAVRKDGEPFWVESNSIRSVWEDEPATISIVRDISKRKEAEEALQRSERRYRLLAENVTDVIWTSDTRLRFTYFSPSVERMLGYTIEEALALRLEELLPHSSLEIALQCLDEELAREDRCIHDRLRSRTLELELNCKDGSSVWSEIKVSFVYDQEGQPVGILGIIRDIGERKRLEEQFLQSQRLEAVGRLASGVAHDFNNLLTAIQGYCDLMLMRIGEDDPLQGHVEEIKKAGVRAADLTRQLLAFSRKQVFQTKILDLNALINDLKKMLERLIGEDVELHTMLEPRLGRVEADPGQIEQVIMNLAVNARDAMPQGGKLTIETANVDLGQSYSRRHGDLVRPGPYVMLAVSDTGTGMDEQTQSRIFEPFFTTKELGKGTGLGLATVYGIVKQSEGFIWVYSEAGQGTNFKIYLRRVEVDGEQVHRERAPEIPLHGSEMILLVEDDEMVRGLARDILRRYGYEVLEARDAQEALKISDHHQGPIHVMVTDVVMPGMSGRQLAERLQSRRPSMEVIYMSGYTDNEIVHRGILDRGVAFLSKPFSPEVLAREVRQILDRAKDEA